MGGLRTSGTRARARERLAAVRAQRPFLPRRLPLAALGTSSGTAKEVWHWEEGPAGAGPRTQALGQEVGRAPGRGGAPVRQPLTLREGSQEPTGDSTPTTGPCQASRTPHPSLRLAHSYIIRSTFPSSFSPADITDPPGTPKNWDWCPQAWEARGRLGRATMWKESRRHPGGWVGSGSVPAIRSP